MKDFSQFNESRPAYSLEPFDAPYNRIAFVFNKVTNSYKYYWIWAILELLREKNSFRISHEDISLRMIELVWYPLTFFKLSFGKQDGFQQIADELQQSVNVNFDGASIISQLNENKEMHLIYHKVRKLIRYVPYRFLTPFFSNELRGLKDAKKNIKIEELAANDSQCLVPYKFYEFGIIINPNWAIFFKSYEKVLLDFIHRNLISFLQKHNPNTIGISTKLVKPENRNLHAQRKLFNKYLSSRPNFNCIYANVPLNNLESIDHFIPWSYVVHDHIWNLIPVSKLANSSKSNRLPKFENYLDPFLGFQYGLAEHIFENYKRGEFYESYASVLKQTNLGSLNEFEGRFKDVFIPLKLNAANLGFQEDWIYQH